MPPTALVSAFVNATEGGAVKVGSLQQFVEAEGDCEERGYSSFPVQEVHKIAVLVGGDWVQAYAVSAEGSGWEHQ